MVFSYTSVDGRSSNNYIQHILIADETVHPGTHHSRGDVMSWKRFLHYRPLFCEGRPSITGVADSLHKRPVMRNFVVCGEASLVMTVLTPGLIVPGLSRMCRSVYVIILVADVLCQIGGKPSATAMLTQRWLLYPTNHISLQQLNSVGERSGDRQPVGFFAIVEFLKSRECRIDINVDPRLFVIWVPLLTVSTFYIYAGMCSSSQRLALIITWLGELVRDPSHLSI